MEVGHKWEPAIVFSPQASGDIQSVATFLGITEQDGKQLAATTVTGPLAERLRNLPSFKPVQWGDGIYGRNDAVTGTQREER